MADKPHNQSSADNWECSCQGDPNCPNPCGVTATEPQEAREQRRAERKERTGLDVEEALTLDEDCGCIGAVIGQHERSCPLSRPNCK